MIHFVVTRSHAYTIRQFLQTWGRDLRPFVNPVTYDELTAARKFAQGTYVFSDLERLSPPQLALASHIATQLVAHPDSFSVLNRPNKALRRFDLLRSLHAAGMSHCNVYRMNDNLDHARYPLFLRRASEHNGAQTPLLNSRVECEQALDQLKAGGAPLDDVIAVEFLNTADSAGVYRKYSAFRVGDRIVARHLFHGTNWVLKLADSMIEPWMVNEELVYLRDHPHERHLRRVFDVAHVEYGRVDYSLYEGAVQVWEINTNPMIAVAPSRIDPQRLAGQGIFVRQFIDAVRAIDRASSAPRLPLQISRPMRAAASERQCWKRRVATLARQIAYRLDPGG